MSDSLSAAWAARKAARRGASRSCNPETEFTAGWEAREAEVAELRKRQSELAHSREWRRARTATIIFLEEDLAAARALIEQLRAGITLLGPDEITPTGARALNRILDGTPTHDPIAQMNAWESARYDKHPRYDDAGTGVENEQERDDD